MTAENAWIHDLTLEYRAMGMAQLLAEPARYGFLLASEGDPTMRKTWNTRLGIAQAEIARREELALPHSMFVDAVPYATWTDLAQQIRERHGDIHGILGAHVRLRRIGIERRTRSDEYAGPCPLCAGDDRFCAFAGPPGRYWCRRCGIAGDVIDAHQLVYNLGFLETVRELALDCGLTVPDSKPARTPAPAPTNGSMNPPRPPAVPADLSAVRRPDAPPG